MFSLDEILNISIAENSVINEEITKIEKVSLESENDFCSDDIENHNNNENAINNNEFNMPDLN